MLDQKIERFIDKNSLIDKILTNIKPYPDNIECAEQISEIVRIIQNQPEILISNSDYCIPTPIFFFPYDNTRRLYFIDFDKRIIELKPKYKEWQICVDIFVDCYMPCVFGEDNCCAEVPLSLVGNKIFITREEAENALREKYKLIWRSDCFMNIIFAKHDDKGKEFCFELTDEQVKYVKKGNLLLVKTCRGNVAATATTDVISGSGAKDVADKSGAYFPLKKVISFIDDNLKEYIYNIIEESVTKKLDSSNKIINESVLKELDSKYEDMKNSVLNSVRLVFDDDLPF